MSPRRQLGWMLLALVAVIASGIGVVYAKHSSRRLFVTQEALRQERDNLDIEWGRLQIEQSTWASPARIEQVAREQFKMRIPEARETVVIEQ